MPEYQITVVVKSPKLETTIKADSLSKAIILAKKEAKVKFTSETVVTEAKEKEE